MKTKKQLESEIEFLNDRLKRSYIDMDIETMKHKKEIRELKKMSILKFLKWRKQKI